MKATALPPRTSSSPCIKFANFEDGEHNVNLLRLLKPYANGDAYVVYMFTNSIKGSLRWSAHKTLDVAEEVFDCLVAAKAISYKMTSGGRTGNYEIPAPKASDSPTPTMETLVVIRFRGSRYGNGTTLIQVADKFSGALKEIGPFENQYIQDLMRGDTFTWDGKDICTLKFIDAEKVVESPAAPVDWAKEMERLHEMREKAIAYLEGIARSSDDDIEFITYNGRSALLYKTTDDNVLIQIGTDHSSYVSSMDELHSLTSTCLQVQKALEGGKQ
jgi:hypothetical protein